MEKDNWGSTDYTSPQDPVSLEKDKPVTATQADSSVNAATDSNPTYTTGDPNLFHHNQNNGGASNYGTPNMYGNPNMQGGPNMYGNPNMQGGPAMYGNPNMQGGPAMYGNPNIQGDPAMYGNPNMQGGPAMYGNPQPPYTYNGYQSKSNGYATASLILGILSILTCLCYGIFGVLLGLPAIVLAYISKSKTENNKMPATALIGLITGILGFLLGCIVFGLVCYIIAHMDDPSSIWYTYMNDIMDSTTY